ncbi:uncharacterized protein EV422DRAFT_623654 [Fimicolochytrium jonesii]|uniref:uncharacterized protein n=1 Tax=Fimicolochytrium jonesii TaxID=1396493 RepID=UPI0022FDEE77|nr:uncharacterized protein EV422DRAFT_623654 [Fimicolochytrium jonesii]KAI8816150.1 hypothetical protein EV422DRAFT_623654 [Fimicolochytrium jonesii]
MSQPPPPATTHREPFRIHSIHQSILFSLLLPATLMVTAWSLWRNACGSMVCPEKSGLTREARMSIGGFYAWLILVSLFLVLAQFTPYGHGHRWKHNFLPLTKHWKPTYAVILVWAIVTLHQAAQFVYWFTAYRDRSARRHTEATVAVLQAAYKAVAYNAAIQLSLTLLPTSRGGFLSGLFGIGYDASLGFHRVSGLVTTLLAFLHFLLFAAYSVLKSGWPSFLRITFLLHAPPSRYTTYHGWLGPIGLLSLLCFIWVTLSSLERVRRRHYNWFWLNHTAVLLAILLSFVHASPMVWFSLPTLVLYAADSCVRVYNRRRAYTITGLRPEACGYLRVDIADCHVAAQPGQWVSVNIPAISRTEWHPFTVASSTSRSRIATTTLNDDPERQHLLYPGQSSTSHPPTYTSTPGLSLIVKPIPSDSSWTHALLSHWSTYHPCPSSFPLTIHIDGPHGRLPPRFLHSDTILLLAGGSGIPGALSIARAVLDSSTCTARKVYLIWTCRDPNAGEMTLWRELAGHPRAPAVLDMRVHVTRDNGKRVRERLDLAGLLEEVRSTPEACSQHASVEGDGGYEAISGQRRRSRPIRSLSVYACGPGSLMRSVQEHVARFGNVVGDGFEAPRQPSSPASDTASDISTSDVEDVGSSRASDDGDEPWGMPREGDLERGLLGGSDGEGAGEGRRRRTRRVKVLLHVEGYGR